MDTVKEILLKELKKLKAEEFTWKNMDPKYRVPIVKI